MMFDTDSLESMCELIVDCPHSTPEWTDSGVIVLRNQNIKNGNLDLSSPSYTTQKDYEARIKRAAPKDGDIVLTREAPMGEVCRIPKGIKCCLGQRQVLLRPRKEVDGDYLFWAIQSPFVQNQIAWSEGTGSTVSNLRIPLIKALKIPRFHGSEKNIGKILTGLWKKIHLNTQTNQTLESIAQTIFKSWFVDFEPVKAKMSVLESGGTREQAELAAMSAISGKNEFELAQMQKENFEDYSQLAETAALFPSAMVESELGEIPLEWEVKNLGYILEPKKGKSITKKTVADGTVPVVAGGLEPAYFHNQANVIAPVITISASGANAGFVRLYSEDIWASDCSYINKTQTSFVYSIYTLLKIRQTEIFGMQQGAAQPHIYPSDLMRLIFVAPPEKIWSLSEKTISGLYTSIAANENQRKLLAELRDSLLPKLLSGEINLQ